MPVLQSIVFIVDKDQEIRRFLILEDRLVEEQYATAPSIIDHYLTYLCCTTWVHHTSQIARRQALTAPAIAPVTSMGIATWKGVVTKAHSEHGNLW